MYVFLCKPRSLSVSRELTVPCQYTKFQNPSVKINMEEKHSETCMHTSLFKREPRADSTLPIHRISKAISENKRGGETEETCMFTSFFKREPRTNSALPIHRISKARSENKHRGQNRTGKRASLPRSLSVSHKVSMKLH